MAQKTEMREEPAPEPVTLPIGLPTPSSAPHWRRKRLSQASAARAPAFRELRIPASTRYRYRDIQDKDRING